MEWTEWKTEIGKGETGNVEYNGVRGNVMVIVTIRRERQG